MNKKALSILEFDKITERLSKYATSAPGKVLCRKLMPSTDLDYIRKCEQDTTAASSRIFAKGSLGFSGLRPRTRRAIWTWCPTRAVRRTSGTP